MFSHETLLVAALALLAERSIGYPDGLYRLIRHPVTWMGGLIGLADRLANRQGMAANELRLRGAIALVLVCAITLAVTIPLAVMLRALPFGWIGEALLATSMLSQRSLASHVEAVADGMHRGLDGARAALGRIVGRDTDRLEESAIARAALESLAENTSDGVMAPLIFMAIAGLPGAALYKAINTADSMIGHRTARHEHFGMAAARSDDVANLPASRLTGLLFAGACALTNPAAGRRAIQAMRRDAPNHVSPNAGWPESALAGALDISLGGTRSYGGTQVKLARMGNGRDELHTSDIRRGLNLYGRALNILLGVLALAAVSPWIFR